MLGGNARNEPVLAAGSFDSQVWPWGAVQGDKMERNKFPELARPGLPEHCCHHDSSCKDGALSDTFVGWLLVLFLKQGLTLA